MIAEPGMQPRTARHGSARGGSARGAGRCRRDAGLARSRRCSARRGRARSAWRVGARKLVRKSEHRVVLAQALATTLRPKSSPTYRSRTRRLMPRRRSTPGRWHGCFRRARAGAGGPSEVRVDEPRPIEGDEPGVRGQGHLRDLGHHRRHPGGHLRVGGLECRRIDRRARKGPGSRHGDPAYVIPVDKATLAF